MSRHYFETVHNGFPVTVVLGWDRPLRYFFMVIEKSPQLIDGATKVEDEEFLYSNLDENDPFSRGLDYYREVLHQFQIDVPESMFFEVQRDCDEHVGNRIVRYESDGSFTE